MKKWYPVLLLAVLLLSGCNILDNGPCPYCAEREEKVLPPLELQVEYVLDALLHKFDMQFEGVYEAVLVENGNTRIAVWANRPLYDFTLHTLTYVENDNGFVLEPDKVLFSAGVLRSPLIVHVRLPGLVPDLGISHVGECGERRYYAILVSGYDGTLFLLDLNPSVPSCEATPYEPSPRESSAYPYDHAE